VNLGGVRLTGGIDYTFPNATLSAGAMLVVPRRASAFAARHPGVATAPEYFQPGANLLDNGGEQIALIAANGADIQRFHYDDATPWPATPDGNGTSLVLIAPQLNPDPNDPLHWRASSGFDGSPGVSDALPLPVSPNGDDNGDGVLNVVEYALGNGARPATATEVIGGIAWLTFTFEREPRADAQWEIETSSNLETWTPIGATFAPSERTTLPGGIERITLRSTAPIGGSPSQFLRARLRTEP
jgi:hypothetical protein